MVLRKRFKNGYQVNIWLNGGYHLIDKVASPSDFIQTAEREFGKEGNEHFLNKCFGFVSYSMPCGTQVNEPLYGDESVWILSPDGQIFATLSRG